MTAKTKATGKKKGPTPKAASARRCSMHVHIPAPMMLRLEKVQGGGLGIHEPLSRCVERVLEEGLKVVERRMG